MIPCPGCGTRNRRGSKYCYHCGQRLDIVFDVSCPACDRLNPAGSIFCAFCGTKIADSLAGPTPAAAVQPAEQPPIVPALPESVAEGQAPAATPPRELPSWLYEGPAGQPEAAAAPSAEPSLAGAEASVEGSKYLRDIPGVLPKTEGWLSSVQSGADRGPPPASKARGGCLMLALLAGLGATLLALINGL